MSRLLPCPRCGGQNLESAGNQVCKESPLDDDDFRGRVRCLDCGLSIARSSYSDAESAEDFAVRAWNARTPEEIEEARQL